MTALTVASLIISALAITISAVSVHYSRRLRRANEEIRRQRERINVILTGDGSEFNGAMHAARQAALRFRRGGEPL